MKVKKAGKRVFGAVMSAAEKKAMDMEIQRQLAEYDRKHIREIDALVLWELREQLGFGNKRLKKFYDNFSRGIEAFSEAINQLAADIVDAWEAVTVTVSAVLDDDALWPNRYGMPPKKYGQSLQKHSKKSFKQYDYIPIMAKNLPYQRRAF